MRILLTNDDGVGAAGLAALESALLSQHEVWTIAPESNRSGTSHAVTLGEASRLRRLGEKRFASSGSPADCVLLAVLGVVKGSIDLVLSGINQGPNLGTDIVYSGTTAAARQGALHGIPSAALSLCSYTPPFDFDRPARFMSRNLQRLCSLWREGSFLSLNFPSRAQGYAGVAMTRPCIRSYRDSLVTFESPRGDLYCFLGGELPGAEHGEGTDYHAVSMGSVSVSRVRVQPCTFGNGRAEESLETLRFVL